MKINRIYVISAIFFLMLIGALYMLLRSSIKQALGTEQIADNGQASGPSSTPSYAATVKPQSPTNKTATESVASNPEPKSSDNDLAAAQKVLKNTMQCEWAIETEKGIRNTLDKKLPPNMSPEIAHVEEQKAKILQDRLASVIEKKKICSEFGNSNIGSKIYPALLNAARLGDRKAASCYLVAPFNPNDMQNDYTGAENYRDNARELIQAGLAQGDWLTVAVLEAATSSKKGTNGWFNNLMPADELTNYKYMKLQQMGATGEYAEQLDGELSAKAIHLVKDLGFSQTDIDSSNQWAEEAYKRYFSSTPKMNGSSMPCSDPYMGLTQ